MDKLGNDELILIMLSMKKQYEERYKIIEDKFNSLELYCREEKNVTLLNSGRCSCCKNIIYKIMEDSEFDNECCIDDNYYNCSDCDKVLCNKCVNDNKALTEYIENPLPNKFRCIKCNDFNITLNNLF